jgi:UMF1 family MFS transporter
MKAERHFIVFACLIGCVQGAIQALSRSFFSLIIPRERNAELFGLYNAFGRLAVFFGPIFMVISIIVSRKLGFDPEIAKRIGVSSLTLLFIIGLLFLIPVFKMKKL